VLHNAAPDIVNNINNTNKLAMAFYGVKSAPRGTQIHGASLGVLDPVDVMVVIAFLSRLDE